jgi:hypothetical protein
VPLRLRARITAPRGGDGREGGDERRDLFRAGVTPDDAEKGLC